MVLNCNDNSVVPSGMGILKHKKLLLHSNRNGVFSNAIEDSSDEQRFLNPKNCSDGTSSVLKKLDDVCVHNCDEPEVVLSDEYHLYVGKVQAFIPKNNLPQFGQSYFSLNIINDDSFFPTVNSTQCVCSPVVRMKPHGSKFHYSEPATIHLPITVSLETNDVVTCLCSDTNIDEDPIWKPLNPEDYTVRGSVIKLKTTHFSFFTAIMNRGYPEASKMIFAGVGGTLDVPEVPGLRVRFPASAVKYDIEATIKVMYADQPYDVDHEDPSSYALAAPVVKLGPTGHKFNSDSIEPVEVTLPLPHGKEILENCGRPYLMFWQSTTAEGQDLEWKSFKTNYRIIEDNDHRLYVCFSVAHFTFYRLFWSVLDSAINGAKIGASYFCPNFEFCISFQAFMSENIDDQTFGLCCQCYKKGTPLESIGNYPIFIGSSGLRMVKSGLLQIRIVSNLFEANTDFGEDALVQREYFTGRPFDKQFACKFVGPRTPGQNTIGKIFIERVHDNSQAESLFDFLLTKPSPSQESPCTTSNAGCHSREADNQLQSNWEGKLSQELANILSIKTDQDLGDGVWEDVARALGYTALEIDMKFKEEEEPFTKLLDDYKKRGGSPNDFISAMYNVGRKTNLSDFERRLQSLPSTSGMHVEDDVTGCAGSISPSRTSSSSGVVLPTAPFNSRKRRHTDAPEGPVSNAKLSEVAERVQDKWKRLGRALELREDQITEIERDYKNDGIQEQAYQMLLTWRESYPDNGYKNLSHALGKLNYNAVARQLYFSP